MRTLTFLWTSLLVMASSSLAPASELDPRSAQPVAGTELPFQSPLSVCEQLVAPLVDMQASGCAWVRTRDMRASLDGTGLCVFPVFGPASPQEWPIRLEVQSVRRGGHSLDLSLAGDVRQEGLDLELPRADLREVYHLSLDEIEQTFVFDSLAGTGDLVVRLDVDTELQVESPEGELRFLHPTLGGVSYGAAFVRDASGVQVPIHRRWTGSGIELVVPGDYLECASFPVTIDPPISAFVNQFGFANDRHPDIVWCGQTDEYLMCWEDYTSAVNSDIFVTSFSATGAQGAMALVEIGAQSWQDPVIAYSLAADRALIVASVDAGNPALSSIDGRFFDVGAFATAGGFFNVSNVGEPKHSPTIGGSTVNALVESNFCVAWSVEWTGTPMDVQYAVLHWDGTPLTPVTTVSLPEADNITPSLSRALGRTDLVGALWTLVWVVDHDQDGLGEVVAQRIAADGTPAWGGVPLIVDATTLNARPSVTSQFDEIVDPNTGRPSIVAYERRVSPVQRDVMARIVAGSFKSNAIRITRDGEDFDHLLDQRRPVIAANGTGFYLAYEEEKWSAPGAGKWDTYMLSGNIVPRAGDPWIALAERHQELGATDDIELELALCTISDGEFATPVDNGACVWMRETLPLPGFGALHGATLTHPTLAGSGDQAIGMQYCTSNPNSVGNHGGRTSGWLWIEGHGDVGSMHTAHALDLPYNKFGFLIASLNEGDVAFPAGSMGHLCLGGAIGRYTSQIALSGPNGRIDTMIDPLAIPQPLGLVAALPGETWHFQLWSRDTHPVSGQPTSNFTNACRVAFAP